MGCAWSGGWTAKLRLPTCTLQDRTLPTTSYTHTHTHTEPPLIRELANTAAGVFLSWWHEGGSREIRCSESSNFGFTIEDAPRSETETVIIKLLQVKGCFSLCIYVLLLTCITQIDQKYVDILIFFFFKWSSFCHKEPGSLSCIAKNNVIF